MAFLLRPLEKLKKPNEMMMVCEWTTLTSHCPLEDDHKRQQI